MKLIEAERKLRAFSEQKRVFRSRELGRVLGESGNTLRSSIKRLLDSGDHHAAGARCLLVRRLQRKRRAGH